MTSNKSPICFISTMFSDHWGGSEELWFQTALFLARKGVPVSGSVSQWSSPHQPFVDLLQAGVKLQQRPTQHKFIIRAWRKIFSRQWNDMPFIVDIEKFLRVAPPALIVLSDGGVLPPVELMELCIENRWPFVTLGHANFQHWWPDDERAERLRNALPVALRCYFVSKSNQLLVERELSCELPNAELIHNPFNVAFDAAPAWSLLGKEDELRLACVARLDPGTKGQDILFEALAHPTWLARRWRLTLYGDGPFKNGLMRLSDRSGLSDHVVFAGHVTAVEKVWSENHVLIMPSRWEGLPLAIVEAMLCGRPVVATNVGGIKEIIEDGVTGFLADAPTAGSVRDALEQMWTRRFELEEMGRAAAKSIREFVPADPVGVFSNKLQQLLL